MSAADKIKLGGAVVGALCALVVLALWIVPYLVERIGGPRFERESEACAVAEAAWWTEYRRTGQWPAEASPAPRRWGVGEAVTRVAGRVADAVLWVARIGARR